MTFAEWIVLKRKAKRMSQAECAKAAGVSTPVWCEYENTEKQAQPRKDTVRKIAQALDVSIEEAMQAAGYDVGLQAEVPAKLLSAWRKVSRASEAKRNAWLDSVDRSADMALF
jgi:transcriptional regulator with XRE-family HTH domain